MTEPCCPCIKVGDTFGLPPEPPVGAELKVIDGDGNRFTIRHIEDGWVYRRHRYSPLHPVGVRVPGVAVGTWNGRDGGENAMTMLLATAALGMTGDQWFKLLQELLGGIGGLIALFLVVKYLLH